MVELQTGWLSSLKNADHVGVTTQIYDNVKETDIQNDMYKAAVAGLKKAIADEDEAYKKTQKDWAVEELKTVDRDLDDYMKGIRSILAGHAALPAGEKTKQTGMELLQLWKDFNFKTNDSYSGESSKVINMFQEVEKRQSDAEELGIWELFKKAEQKAKKIQELLDVRFTEMATRVIGEVRNMRQATDVAIKRLYTVLDSLQMFAPGETLTTLLKKLRAIEDYARLYYLKGTASERDDTPEDLPDALPDGGDDEEDKPTAPPDSSGW